MCLRRTFDLVVAERVSVADPPLQVCSRCRRSTGRRAGYRRTAFIDHYSSDRYMEPQEAAAKLVAETGSKAIA
jgi:hypothetical protein